MKRIFFAAAAAALAAAAFPALSAAASFTGTVVSQQAGRHVLVVASASGAARTVHTGASLRAGTLVAVVAGVRPDGTFAATRVRALGHTSRARITGVVIRRTGALTFLSANRSVLVVRGAGRRLASAADGGPQPGTVATVTVTVSGQGTLNTVTITPASETTSIVIQATVAAVTPATATTAGSLTLTINGQTLVIPLPAGTVLPATVAPNATVTLTISFGPAGPSGQPCACNRHGDDEADDEDDDGGDDASDD